MKDNYERGHLSDKPIARDSKRERARLERWFVEFEITNFKGRYLTRQYYENLERLEEIKELELQKKDAA
jgi:hypothetical protein